MDLYLLCCASENEGGGIYRYELTENGNARLVGSYACDRPMYAVRKNERLCVLLRQPFEGTESGYFEIDETLNASSVSQTTGTKGVCACHLAVDGEDVYVANYLSGNLVKNGRTVQTHEGKGTHERRQEAPHTHFVGLSPDQKYVLCCDLGVDTIYVYDRALRPISRCKVPDGYGVRHFVFSACGGYVYAINELYPSVSTFAYADGRLTYLSTTELPVKVENSTAAAIRISEDGKRLYCSVRGENALYVLSVDGEKTTLVQKQDCGGKGPRDLWLTSDGRLVSCNENSNDATVFAVKDGRIAKRQGKIENLQGVLCCLQ